MLRRDDRAECPSVSAGLSILGSKPTLSETPHELRNGSVRSGEVAGRKVCVLAIEETLVTPMAATLHVSGMEARMLAVMTANGLINSADGIIDSEVDGLRDTAHIAVAALAAAIISKAPGISRT